MDYDECTSQPNSLGLGYVSAIFSFKTVEYNCLILIFLDQPGMMSELIHQRIWISSNKSKRQYLARIFDHPRMLPQQSASAHRIGHADQPKLPFQDDDGFHDNKK